MTDLEQKLNSGKVYQVIAQENQDPRFSEYLEKMEKYNTLGYTERAEKEKQQILKELFAEIGNNSYIQAPYHAMWGGRHVHLGKNVYINFNCTFVDDAQVYIGDDTLIAPNVTIITASHPISPALWAQKYGCNWPVFIEKMSGSHPMLLFFRALRSEIIRLSGPALW